MKSIADLSQWPVVAPMLSPYQFVFNVRDGSMIFLWHDNWHQLGILKSAFGNLFGLSRFQNCSIEEVIMLYQLEGSQYDGWLTRQLTVTESLDSSNLWQIIRGVSLSSGKDTIKWKPTCNTFSVKDCYEKLLPLSHATTSWDQLWSIKARPPKYKFSYGNFSMS